MSGIWDPFNYHLDPTDPSMSLSDSLKLSSDIISQNDPALAGGLQRAYGQPSALPTAQPTGTPAMMPLGAPGTSIQGPSQMPNPIEQIGAYVQALPKGVMDEKFKKSLLESLDNQLQPPETVGPTGIGEFLTGQKGGKGGILGLGITPMDVLAFALGAAITSKLPQSQAIATTMAIAKMPSQMRTAAQQASSGVITQKIEMLRLQAQENALQQTQIENGVKLQKIMQGWDTEQKVQGAYHAIQDHKIDPTTHEGQAALLAAGVPHEAVSILTKEHTTAAKNINQTELQAFVSSEGRVRGVTIPPNMTLPDATQTIKDLREIQQQNLLIRVDADRRQQQAFLGNKPIDPKEASLWVDSGGNSLPKQYIGKPPSDLPEGSIRLRDANDGRALQAAKALPRIGQDLNAIAPQLLTRYKGFTLGQIFEVKGNALAIKARQAASDPLIKRFQADLTDFLVSAPLAMGQTAGREGPALLARFEPGMPNFSSTVEGVAASISTNINNVNARWLDRGIDITKMRENAGIVGSSTPPPPGARIRDYSTLGR